MNNDEVIDAEFTEPQRELAVVQPAHVAVQASDVLAQLDAAHRYPRSLGRFLADAKAMATLTRETAQACIYTVPRGGKQLTGPSIRLAETCVSAWGNTQFGARVVDVGDEFLTAEGVCWDMQTNVRVTLQVQRRITDKHGRRFNEDMIGVAGAAACSIALRNAIFRVVPRAYVNAVYDHARKVAVGDAKTLEARRADLFDRLTKLGVTQERILARIGKSSVADVGLDEMEILIGIGTAIKEGDATIDDAFPAIVTAPVAAPEDQPQGQRINMRGKKTDATTITQNGEA